MKKKIAWLMSVVLALSLTCPVLAAQTESELDRAGKYLKEQGIMVGDNNGDMIFGNNLARAHLAVLLARLVGNPEHLAADQSFYASQCVFTDVPDWAKSFVGFCYTNGLVAGYGNGLYGANDPVTPAAAYTVMLRFLEVPADGWSYHTACAKAVELGLAPSEALTDSTITRGDMAVLMYRALGSPLGTATTVNSAPASTGTVALPTDGSQYVPKTGDVIRCNDGTDYTITDVSRYDANMFASGSLGPLPKPVCDWSLMPQVALPTTEARHITANGKDYLFLRNVYETRRMLYTLYNAIGSNPETWQNGAPVLFPSGNAKVRINLTIAPDLTAQSFWPWRADQITGLFDSCPPGTYSMEAWDVFCSGIFQYTEYKIHVV